MAELAQSGDDERAANGPRARTDQEKSVELRSALEDVASEHRQKNNEGKGEQRHRKCEKDERLHGRLLANEAEALLHALEHRFGPAIRSEVRPDDQQRNNYSEEGYAVHREAPGCAPVCQGQAAQHWADHAREVELNGIERNGVGKILSFDE